MKRNWASALIPVACLAVSACDFIGKKGDGKEPVGQVVATVNGEEITLLELRAELASQGVRDPKLAKAAEQAALQAVIGRKVLANAAREQQLDKTPEFALQRLRTMDVLLVQDLQTRIASEVPPPTREEAQHFVTDHADIFSGRKIFVVDQIRMPQPTDPKILREFEPIKTMEEVERLLEREHIDHQRATNNTIDAIGTDPKLIEQIVKLPPGEVFVIPGGGGVLVNQIRETRVVPYTGEPAVTYALELLRRQRIQETVGKEFNVILTKSASSIQYNKAYRPTPPAGNPTAQPYSTPAGNQVTQPDPRPDSGPGNGR